MISIKSQHSVDVTVQRFKGIIANKGLTLFASIDHKRNAENIGLSLIASQVLIFGNPVLGTPIISAAPQAALDLPQKLLVREDDSGDVWLCYENPEDFKQRHGIERCDEVISKIATALDALANAAASR